MVYYQIFIPLFAYVLGNFNAGIIVSRFFFRKDLRQHGSKNPGTTNAFRVLGKAAGMFVLLLDSLKGVAAVAVAKWLLPGEFWTCIAGFCVMIGHIYPILFKFKGGKGVATTVGVTLILQPPVLLLDSIPFFILLFGLKYMSVASITCGLLLPMVSLAYYGRVSPVFWLSLAQGLLILFTHRSNIKRLFRHEENKLFQKKTASAVKDIKERSNG